MPTVLAHSRLHVRRAEREVRILNSFARVSARHRKFPAGTEETGFPSADNVGNSPASWNDWQPQGKLKGERWLLSISDPLNRSDLVVVLIDLLANWPTKSHLSQVQQRFLSASYLTAIPGTVRYFGKLVWMIRRRADAVNTYVHLQIAVRQNQGGAAGERESKIICLAQIENCFAESETSKHLS